jgi:flagellar basal body-associated protein FliL
MKDLTLSTKIMITIFIIILLAVIGMGVLAGLSNNQSEYTPNQTESPF